MATRGVKQLQVQHLDWLSDWIIGRKITPSYSDICEALEARWGVRRAPDVIRKRKEVQRALSARKEAERNKRQSPRLRPTARRMEQLESQVERLTAENAALRSERDAVIERNLMLVNAMKAHQVPESRIERPLGPINRDPTKLQTRNSR